MLPEEAVEQLRTDMKGLLELASRLTASLKAERADKAALQEEIRSLQGEIQELKQSYGLKSAKPIDKAP